MICFTNCLFSSSSVDDESKAFLTDLKYLQTTSKTKTKKLDQT